MRRQSNFVKIFKKPAYCPSILTVHWHPLEASPGEKFPGKHCSFRVHRLFFLYKRNHILKGLKRNSCELSFEAILASILGKVCRLLQWHHTKLGEFCHPRDRVQPKRKHSSAHRAFHKLFWKFLTTIRLFSKPYHQKHFRLIHVHLKTYIKHPVKVWNLKH